jgi:hypothetical protein
MQIFLRQHRLLFVFTLLLLSQLVLPLVSPTATITVTIYFGKPPDCTGRGLCKISVGWKTLAPAPGTGAERTARPPRIVEGSAVMKENKLYVDFKSALPEKMEMLPVAENLVLDAPTARAFASKSVTVLKGDYKIDYSKNRFGSVVLNLEPHN